MPTAFGGAVLKKEYLMEKLSKEKRKKKKNKSKRWIYATLKWWVKNLITKNIFSQSFARPRRKKTINKKKMKQ